MNLDIIIKIIIPILGAIVTYMIVPFILQKTTKEQREGMYSIIKTTVFAAEQLADAGLIDIPKKEYVKEYVINYLASKGKDITIKDLDIMIEAAVKELNIEQR